MAMTPYPQKKGVGGYNPPPVLSEINVTPFVDVMLVLLIIFMVAAPLLQQGVEVDLPKTQSPSLSEQEKQVVLVVKPGGRLEINKNEISVSALSQKIKAIYAKRLKKEIFIQADQSVPYGTVADIMSRVQMAGITR